VSYATANVTMEEWKGYRGEVGSLGFCRITGTDWDGAMS
jgi:hypothetical protein